MQYGDEKKEKLNNLERKLYSRNAPNIIDPGRSEFKESERGGNRAETEQTNESWPEVKASSFDELAKKVSNMAQKKNHFVKNIFIFSLLFFIVAAGVAAYVFFGGSNLVSSKNVDIKVVGPISIGGGQEVSLDVNIINNNNVDLSSAALSVEYPDGTRSAVDLSKALTQERFQLDIIKSGASFNQNIKAVFFGDKDTIKQIQLSLEYRVENSSALFYKEKVYELSISSAPVIVTPTYPKEVNSGQEISFNIEVASNSKDKISNFLVKAEYPFGFNFESASPSAAFGNNIWQFSNLNSGEKKTIAIRGNIVGQDNEEKVFKISSGEASENDERQISVPFSDLMESILVKKPFIGLNVSVGGQNGDYATNGGNRVETRFIVRNNLPSRIFNTSVEVSFKGGALNQSSIKPGENGFFQSFNNTILWDKRSLSELTDMGPGSEKQFSFSLSPLLYSEIASGAKPNIEITITVKGERILESGSPEMVSATETRKIVLATDLVLTSKTTRSQGSIENSGPVPPKADTPTTYNVVWSISNTFNQVSNVEVRATLPAYVKWTNLKSPAGEIISFNQVTKEMVWNVGSVLPNTGFGSNPKQVYFQLEFLPSISQIGRAQNLIGDTYISGVDKITGVKIESKISGVTTNFSGDPDFKVGDDRVVQ
ncbi:MAG: hypothetical protein AAB446_01715 [Patescibacteria group bacterium]